MLTFTDQQLLTVIAKSDATQYITSLCLFNLETDEITRLPGAFEFSGRKDVINDAHLAYASAHDGVSDILLYNLNTGDIVFVGPGIPVAFSPDGTSLLCHDYYSIGTYLYNLNSNTQGPAPVALNYYYNTQVRWNEEGIMEANMSTYDATTIEVHNLTKNTLVTRSSVISSENIYLSPSGHKLIHSNASCPSPYLKFCPDQGNKIALLMADIFTNDDIELFAEKVDAGIQISIYQLEFSPNENSIAFIRNGHLYITPN